MLQDFFVLVISFGNTVQLLLCHSLVRSHGYSTVSLKSRFITQNCIS